MKKAGFPMFVFFLLTVVLTAQADVDSLWQVWENTKLPDTVRLDALQAMANRYANSNPDSARMMAEKQLAFAREKNLPLWEGQALNSIGLSWRFQSDFEKALRHYERSIEVLEAAGDRDYLSAVYGNMADVYRLQSNFPQAIACLSKCLSLAEETGNQKRAANAYVAIATIFYEDPGDHEKTLEYLEKARQIYESLGYERGMSLVYGNLAAVHLDRDELELALDFIEKSMVLQQKTGDQHGLATSLHNRAVIKTSQGKYREAMADFDREMAIFERIGDQEGLADAFNSMGDLWIGEGHFATAIHVCGKALRIGHALGSPNFTEAEAAHCLYQAHLKAGNHLQALGYLEQYVALKDSLQRQETAQRLKQMEIERQSALDSLEKFELELAHEQAIRRKDRALGWLTAGVLGVLAAALALLVGLLMFRRRSLRLQARSDALQKQQLLSEVALLRTQVNPHFLFNSLSILSSLVHVDANLSEQFIEQLSRSYRYILEQKEQTLVTLRTELEFIRSYVFLLKIRFENKFDLQIDIPENLLDTHKIAPLTLQLLVENAVKHNRMSLKEPLVVSVSVENGQTLVVKNRLQPRSSTATSTGMGLQNISNRYALLTNRPVWAGETEEEFVVRVPLLG